MSRFCNRCGAEMRLCRDGFYRGLYYCADFCISLGMSDEEAAQRKKERNKKTTTPADTRKP